MLPLTIDVTLGGVQRQLRVTFQTLVLVDRVTGRSPASNSEWWASLEVLQALLWAALHHDPRGRNGLRASDAELASMVPTLEQVGDWIVEAGIDYVQECLLAAMTASAPVPKPGEQPKEKEEVSSAGDPLPSTGTPSAPTPGSTSA